MIKKFEDPYKTAQGDDRAWVPFNSLDILWFNTGTLCNIECKNCYMESSPKNDTLVYLTAAEVDHYVQEAQKLQTDFTKVGFTGGEPFLNKDMIKILENCLQKDLHVLVLTNAMKPLQNHQQSLLELNKKYPNRMTMRVSLDHYTKENHDQERGRGSFDSALLGMKWLSDNDFLLNVAGRSRWQESVDQSRQGYEQLLSQSDIQLSGDEPLVVFPEMKPEDSSPPEITTGCWEILNKDPSSIMCATSRMVVKRRGSTTPTVARCTLLPFDPFFDSGEDLSESLQKTHLKHVYCAQFCVLGGASCS